VPTEVSVGPEHGLERESVVDCDDPSTVGSDLLTRRIGDLDVHTQGAVDRALRIALTLS
jgi:mRNA-degrading endonuclease toxin of MazEF toxin-antitoxin module